MGFVFVEKGGKIITTQNKQNLNKSCILNVHFTSKKTYFLQAFGAPVNSWTTYLINTCVHLIPGACLSQYISLAPVAVCCRCWTICVQYVLCT